MAGATSNLRPWWLAPGPAVFGLVIVGACGWFLLEDRIVPPKPVDIRDRVTVSGGATFCDPVPLPPSQRPEGSATPTAAPPAK